MTNPHPIAERLLSLAERCEAATGPDRDLNEAIADVLGLRVKNAAHQTVYLHNGKPGSTAPLRYTASLDAAMTLYLRVPERVPANPRLATAEALRQRAEAA